MESEVSPGSVLLDRPPPRTGLPGSKIIGSKIRQLRLPVRLLIPGCRREIREILPQARIVFQQCWK